MKKCPDCGHSSQTTDFRCPECGSYYSKIIELIDQTAEEEARYTWQARWQRVMDAEQKRPALQRELAQFRSELSPQASMVLIVVFMFVFALVFAI